jgi:hypothetical protein
MKGEASVQRVVARFIDAASKAWTEKEVRAAISTASKAVRDMLPGVFNDLETASDATYWGPGTYIQYKTDTAALISSLDAWPDVPFSAVWSEERKKFKVTSFLVDQKLRNAKSVWSFLSNPSKVKALIRKGLKSIDPGEADLYSGKKTPESLIKRVLKVESEFDVIDEWHSTGLIITLMLRTAKNVPERALRAWLKSHWSEVRALAPSDTPEAAGAPSRWASWDDDDYYDDDDDDYDDDGDTDWMMDYPEEGLGWVAPNEMGWRDVEHFSYKQDGRRAVVRVSVSIR